MRIKIRHVEQATGGVDFTEIHFSELDKVIEMINRSGGVYYEGGTEPFHSYQLVLDETGAYAEIIIGEDKS